MSTYKRWAWVVVVLVALWVLFMRDAPMPRSWGNWEASGQTPEAAAAAFLPPDSEGGDQRSSYTLGPFAWVKIHRSIPGDDSVRSVEYTVKLRKVDGTWRVSAATYRMSCHRNLWVLNRSCG